jgi:hypothetical protein
MRVEVRRFNPQALSRGHFIVLVVGKRNTGKTVLMRDILGKMGCVDYPLLFTPTEDTRQEMAQHIPDTLIYDEYKSAVVSKFVKFQKEGKEKSKCHKGLVVLDDCMYDKAVMKGPEIRNVFMNGRHYNVSFVFTQQYAMDLSPDLRGQVDYVFCLRENIIANRLRLHRNYFGVYEFEEFQSILDQCTSDYECLVIDNTVASTKKEDVIYWYKASMDPPPFRLGTPQIWESHERHHSGRHSSRSQLASTKVID